jgi:hypothetical protein
MEHQTLTHRTPHRHATGCKLHHHLEPLTHEVLYMRMRDLRCGPALLHHGLEGKEKQHPISSTTLSPISRSISLPLYLFRRRGGGKEAGPYRT